MKPLRSYASVHISVGLHDALRLQKIGQKTLYGGPQDFLLRFAFVDPRAYCKLMSGHQIGYGFHQRPCLITMRSREQRSVHRVVKLTRPLLCSLVPTFVISQFNWVTATLNGFGFVHCKISSAPVWPSGHRVPPVSWEARC